MFPRYFLGKGVISPVFIGSALGAPKGAPLFPGAPLSTSWGS